MVEKRLMRAQQEVGKVELGEVEDIVEDAVREAGALSARSSRDGRYVDITVGLSSPGGSNAGASRARIWTSGVEAFFLDLPGGFTHREFDHEREG